MKTSHTKSSRGRPRKEPVPGERHPVTVRLGARSKGDLEVAADQTGRSLSQEIEFRLELSFRDDQTLGGGETAMLLRTLAAVIWNIEERTGASWRKDYPTAMAVSAALATAIRAMSPKPDAIDNSVPADVLDRQGITIEPHAAARAAEYDAELESAFQLGDELMVTELRRRFEISEEK